MRLLLDTHILLWWLSDDPALASQVKTTLADPAHDVFVSAATAWEISIKHALGKLQFPVAQTTSILAESGFTPLAITVEHATAAGALPPLHHDPFDRMLVAQAQQDGLTIVTADPMIRRYAVAVFNESPAS